MLPTSILAGYKKTPGVLTFVPLFEVKIRFVGPLALLETAFSPSAAGLACRSNYSI